MPRWSLCHTGFPGSRKRQGSWVLVLGDHVYPCYVDSCRKALDETASIRGGEETGEVLAGWIEDADPFGPGACACVDQRRPSRLRRACRLVPDPHLQPGVASDGKCGRCDGRHPDGVPQGVRASRALRPRASLLELDLPYRPQRGPDTGRPAQIGGSRCRARITGQKAGREGRESLRSSISPPITAS
jgi:hypothetical protein